MTIRSKIFTPIAALGLAAGMATSGFAADVKTDAAADVRTDAAADVTVENRGTQMTDAELKAALQAEGDHRIVMTEDGSTIVLQDENRFVHERENEPQRVGTYRINDSRFCMKYTEEEESCYEFWRAPNERVSVWAGNRPVGHFSVH